MQKIGSPKSWPSSTSTGALALWASSTASTSSWSSCKARSCGTIMPDEDELFFVLQGSLRMDYRDPSGQEKTMEIGAGEMVIVPRGTEHCPSAAGEVHVLLSSRPAR